MTTAAPTVVVLAASICGMACVTLSGCFSPPPPRPPAPLTPQDAWDLYRDAFERRNIFDLMKVFPESDYQNCVTQYTKENFGPDFPSWDTCSGPSYNTETCYGDVLLGMVGPPSIIDVKLDLNGSDPNVAFVWSGPGVDIAAEMIAWDENNLVKWHAAYIKKNSEYGQKPDVKARATGVHAAQQEPRDPWIGMDQQWQSRNMDALLRYFGNESKLLAYYGGSIEEFVGPTGIRSFFEANTNGLSFFSASTDVLRTAEGNEGPEAGSITVGARNDEISTGERLLVMTHSPDWNTIKLQVVVEFKGSRSASYVV